MTGSTRSKHRWVETSRTAVLSLALFGTTSCAEEEIEWQKPPPPSQGQPRAKSADRLPAGELLEGPDEAFGFAIPKGMKMSRPTRKSVRASGPVNFDQLTEYVKDRIAARHAEMLDNKLVFPTARIKGNKTQIFEVTLRERGRLVHLDIRDMTPLPRVHGLSEKQRWEKAGLKPTGGLIDPRAME